MSKSSWPMPAPRAVIRVPIWSEPSILSKRARSTLRILPRSGSTAWFSRLRACLAEPPAESPSTRKISDLAGSFSWQSASLPGGGGLGHLLHDQPRFGRMFLEPARQALAHQPFDGGAHLGRDQLVLGLGG